MQGKRTSELNEKQDSTRQQLEGEKMSKKEANAKSSLVSQQQQQLKTNNSNQAQADNQKQQLKAQQAEAGNRRKANTQTAPRQRRSTGSSEQAAAAAATNQKLQKSSRMQERNNSLLHGAQDSGANVVFESASNENICAACAKPIKERYLLVALDKQWHEDCLKCACCDCRLGEVGSSLFTHSGKILCRRDFQRIFGQHGHCAACKKSIPPYEMVMRAQENAYHMDCFACQQCQYRFCVGDRFHLTDQHRIVCIFCHSEAQSSSSLSGGAGANSTTARIAEQHSPSSSSNEAAEFHFPPNPAANSAQAGPDIGSGGLTAEHEQDERRRCLKPASQPQIKQVCST